MGFNKMFLPEVERLEDQLNKVGEFEFTRYWKNRFNKADAIMGPVQSVELIEKFILKEHEIFDKQVN